MSVESISKVLNATLDVTPTAKLVLVGIANHDGDGGAWPSINTLAKYAGVSTRSVQRAIAQLESAGLVTRHMQGGGTAAMRDHTRPNLYIIHFKGRGDTSVTPPVTPASQGGDTSVAPRVTPASPKPSYEPSTKPSVENTSSSLETTSAEVLEEWEGYFNSFWKAYPRSVGKPTAQRAFKKLFDTADMTEMAHGLHAWVNFWSSSETDESFIPHAGTWLNDRRWEATPPVPAAPKAETPEQAIRRIAERDDHDIRTGS